MKHRCRERSNEGLAWCQPCNQYFPILLFDQRGNFFHTFIASVGPDLGERRSVKRHSVKWPDAERALWLKSLKSPFNPFFVSAKDFFLSFPCFSFFPFKKAKARIKSFFAELLRSSNRAMVVVSRLECSQSWVRFLLTPFFPENRPF